MELKETEIAWAAGFFDGEGHCRAHRVVRKNGKTHYYLHVIVPQVNKANLDRFVSAIGVGKVDGPYTVKNPNAKPQFRVQLYCRQAKKAIETIWPYLGEEKRTQAEAAMSK
jgi:hypothetical protein